MFLFIEELFVTTIRWEQPRFLSRDERINKMLYEHTADYNSALKRKEILTQAAVWMNPEAIF